MVIDGRDVNCSGPREPWELIAVVAAQAVTNPPQTKVRGPLARRVIGPASEDVTTPTNERRRDSWITKAN
jgi:hypothetical protein